MKKTEALTQEQNPEPSKFDEFWKKYKPLAMFLVGIMNAIPILSPFTNSIKKAVGAIEGSPRDHAIGWLGFTLTLVGLGYYIYLTVKGDPSASTVIDVIDNLNIGDTLR